MLMTVIKYNITTSKRGKAKAIRIEKHYCSDTCLKKANGYGD